jgi:hypothetical protein
MDHDLIWLHPYERGGRLMEKLGRSWRPATGSSVSEAPYSPAMEAFMRRHGITEERRFG